MPSYDSPWKEALYQHLRPMLTLLFPRLAGRIDWREDHHPLEQELRNPRRENLRWLRGR